MLTHNITMTFPCEKCDIDFSTELDLAKDRETTHDFSEFRNMFNCKVCDLTFFNVNILNQHHQARISHVSKDKHL